MVINTPGGRVHDVTSQVVYQDNFRPLAKVNQVMRCCAVATRIHLVAGAYMKFRMIVKGHNMCTHIRGKLITFLSL